MPVVPVAEQTQTLQPVPGRRSTVTASAAAFGANDADALTGVGRAVNQAADINARTAEVFRQREDAQAVRQAMIEFDGKTRALLNDPETGLYSRRGATAVGISKTALKSLDDYEREVGDGLQDRQRELFATRVASVKMGTLNSVSRFESDQFRLSEVETLDGALNSSINNALDAYNSPDLIESYKVRGEEDIAQLAALHGWSAELQASKVSDYRALLHKGVVERLLVDDPTGARAYFEAHQDEIDGGTELVLQKALKVGGVRKASQQQADRIFIEATDIAEQRRMAREIDDSEIRDETLRRVNARHGEEEQQRNEREKRLKSDVWSSLAQGGSLDAVSPSVLSQIDGNTLATMQRYEDSRGAIETNWETYTDLQTADPETLVGIGDDIIQFRGQLSDPDYRSIVGLQRSYRDAIERANASGDGLDSVGAINTQLGSIADASGLSGSDNTERKGKFMQAARTAVFAKQAELNRDLSPQEVSATVAPFVHSISLPRLFSDKVVTVSDVLGTEDENSAYVPYDEIPERSATTIKQWLQSKGRPVTKDAVSEMYTRDLLLRAR